MAYKIFETQSFSKQLKKNLNAYEERLILAKLKQKIYPQIKKQPYFGKNIKKLRSYDPETWRYRIGNFRLFYSIDEVEKVVVITALRLRKDAYR